MSPTTTTQRMQQLQQHLSLAPTKATGTAKQAKSPSDIVITCAIRTPIARARKGAFKDTHPEDLLAAVLKGVLDKTGIDAGKVEDIVVGNVLAPSGGATISRMASLAAGFPDTTSLMMVNRQCSSGLQAVESVANSILAGKIDIGIAAGVESMTMGYGPGAMPPSLSERVMAHPSAADCQMPMGLTSENVAKAYGISRDVQDAFAADSHKKAAAAQAAGLFKEEIIPVATTVIPKGADEAVPVTVSADEGIRANTTAATLGKLRAAFAEDGTTTAGNASQVSDGAAAVLLMTRATAMRLGMKILARYVDFACVGVPPKVMGIGPAFAIPAVLKKAGLGKDDIDVYEINEAFASQAVYSVKEVGINPAKVNPKGGAIALGHPLGCTGARQIATLLPELRRTGGKYGVVSMCIGTGMGAAAIIENEA